jgi:peptidoglycan/LPS O-acetylase OafA/YrhL
MTLSRLATPPASGTPRLDYLDTLRGVAALSVMWFHYVLAGKGSHGAFGDTVVFALTEVVDLGKVGVVLFFAISGFIIPASIRGGSASPVRQFVIGRFFRLYPAYWISILLCLTFLKPENWPGLYPILSNASMVQGFLGARDINGVAWTLQIELVFYMVCLGLFVSGILGSRRVQLAAVLCSMVLALCLAGLRYGLTLKLPVALPLAMSIMFFGCLWRGAVLEAEPVARRLSVYAALTILLLLPPICVLAYSVDLGFKETWYRYLLSYIVGLGVFLLFTTRLRIRGRILVHLGTISYSVYLLHTPIHLGVERLGLLPAAGSSPLIHWLSVGMMMMLVICVSHVSYIAVEKPCIALGRSLARRGTFGGAAAYARH